MDHPKTNQITLNGVTIGVDEKGKVIPDNKAIQVETGNKDMAIPTQDNIILENGQIIGENGEVYITIAPDAVKALFNKKKAQVKNTKKMENGEIVLEDGTEIVVIHPELLRVLSEKKKPARKTKAAAQGREE